jgi:GNAT superfamily N-acetyltransferase
LIKVTAARLAELSALDEERFGVRTAKTLVSAIEEVPALIDFCRDQGARLLIVRCPAGGPAVAQALEDAGCRLMDVLAHFTRDLQETQIPADLSPVRIRPAGTEDVEAVVGIARESFRGYQGHYHADPRLDRKACDEVYVSWARRSCLSRQVADEVLVAEDAGILLGFLTLQRNSAEEGQAVLSGVAPAAQGKGIFHSFMVRGMAWCRQGGARRMVYSTQITNIAGQKVVARLGFEMHHSYLTFHKWFDV